MKFEKEFKDAISELSDSEKNKLILRLLRHDRILTERLHFELLGTQSVEERRAEMEAVVKDLARRMSEPFRNIGYLAVQVRSLSGQITEHVKITKDKFGDVSLNLLMLNEVLKRNAVKIDAARPDKAHKLSLYVVMRAFKLLIQIQALHEDYFLEFREDLEQLGEYMGKSNYLMRTASHNGFDVNWLLNGEIPERVAEIQKQFKAGR